MATATRKQSPVKSATTTKKPVERLRGSKTRVESVTDTLTLAKLPNGNGGVRFDGKVLKGIYVPQRQWADMGKPETLALTLRPAA